MLHEFVAGMLESTRTNRLPVRAGVPITRRASSLKRFLLIQLSFPAGYVYTVAMALALLYLYTQHFSYVQAVYLFVMFHAALAGALRAEPSRSNNPGEATVSAPQVAAILAEGSANPPEQSWVTMWVPGRGVVLQRTVYFALLASGGAMFAGKPCVSRRSKTSSN